MPTFQYKGYQQGKGAVAGNLDAASRTEAKKILQSQGISLTSISEGKEAASRKNLIQSTAKIQGGKKIAEVFLAKILQLHNGGMPVGDAVKTMKDRIADKQQKALAQQIWQDLSEGATLAAAMKRFPGIFDNTIVYAVEAGEASGNLSSILQNVVENLRAQAQLKKNIYSAMMYPIFVCLIALCVAGLFLFFLLPRIEKMMSAMGGEMGLAAKLMVGSAAVAMWGAPILIIGLIIFYIWLRNWRKTKVGRRTTDGWLLNIPIVGGLLKQSIYAQISNLMATLISSGVNTTESMGLSEKLIQNRVMNERFKASQKLINDGAALSTSFKVNHFFPDLALDILSVGENTGDIGHSFKEIAQIYSKELEDNLKKLTTVVSSVALGFAFLMVSVLAISIVSSVLQFSSSIISK